MLQIFKRNCNSAEDGDSLVLVRRSIVVLWIFRISIIGRILMAENHVFQVGTKNGILKNLFCRNDFSISGIVFNKNVSEISLLKLMSTES